MKKIKLAHRFGSLTWIAVILLTACAPAAAPQIQQVEVTRIVAGETVKEIVEVTAPAPEVKLGPGGEPLAAEQVLRRLERSKKESVSPNGEGSSGRDYIRVVWKSLLDIGPDGELIPALADSVEVSADEKVYTAKLNPNAVFSNGKPITALDVKKCWEWGDLATRLPSWGASHLILTDVVGMEDVNLGKATEASGLKVIDDHTLEITLKTAVHQFKGKLASYNLGVFDVSEKVDDINYWKKPTVSGPYLFEWDIDSGLIVITPNPKWWGNPVIIQRVEFGILADPQARLIAYENEEVDILKDTGDLTAELLAMFGDQLVRIPSHGLFYFGFNTINPPTDDVHVRRAMVMALDREKIVEGLFPNRNVTHRVVQEGSLCYNKDLPALYNPEQAKAELALSKYGANIPTVHLQYWTSITYWARIVAAFQEAWKQELGLTVELHPTDKALPGMNLMRLSGGPAVNDPADFLSKLVTIGGPTVTDQSYTPSQEMNDLALKADLLPDSAADERCKLYNELEKMYLIDDAGMMPVTDVPYRYLVAKKVKGFYTNTNQDIPWDTMYVVQQ